ncbi:MAG: hypothetical protein ABIQ11_12460 [Saprospiraceae bacterium]
MRTQAFIAFLLFLSLLSCQKDNIVIPVDQSRQIIGRSDGGVTILGNRLTNPFTVSNVRAAYSELYNDGHVLNQTHKYVRFLPSNEGQVKTLVDNFEVIEDTPMDYEIVHSGDYYHDAGRSEADFTWLYTVVPVNKTLPYGIQSEVIADLILIKPTTALYYKMYERTGNGHLLENGRGDCTPGCSNFPCCFDENIPCADQPCNIDDDVIECYRGGPNWPDCLLDEGDGSPGGGGTSPPNSCGCNNNVNPLRPSGKISVEDTQLGLQGVKNITMRAQNDIFGFSWSFTQSDVNGCFKFDRSFTAKNISIKALYRNDRIWMRSFRGARIWNMILLMEATKRTIQKPYNNICLNFMDDNSNGQSSKSKEEWTGCTAFNAIEEYHILKSGFGLTLPSGRLAFTITHHGSTAAAPMLSEEFEEDLLDDIVLAWLAIEVTPLAAVLLAIREGLPDIWFPYDLNKSSDKMKQTMYHELGHASHYTKVNTTDFWGRYRTQIILYGAYGDGNDPYSELVAVAEPFAETVGVIMADLIYGPNHSNGDPVLHRWLHLLEEKGVVYAPSEDWIPWGIYLDFIDFNPNYPLGVYDPINDNISGYSINSIFQQLNGNVRDMNNLRTQMSNILPAGNSVSNLNLIFTDYGY